MLVEIIGYTIVGGLLLLGILWVLLLIIGTIVRMWRDPDRYDRLDRQREQEKEDSAAEIRRHLEHGDKDAS